MSQTEKLTRNNVELSRTGSYNDAAADRPSNDSLPTPAPFRLPAPQTRAKTADNLGIARASVYRALEAG
jgi:hypothetical protein